jgi:DNA-binding response OmpR family regulator
MPKTARVGARGACAARASWHNTMATKQTKILIADDDPAVLRLVEMILSRQGIRVITARDGEEALHKALTETPDAILLDIQMPKLDGIQVCSKLKATEKTAGIPIGFLTVHKEIEYYKQAQELGSILYMLKPFKPEKLIHSIGVLLSSKGHSPKL